jgi:hypothetical protein
VEGERERARNVCANEIKRFRSLLRFCAENWGFLLRFKASLARIREEEVAEARVGCSIYGGCASNEIFMWKLPLCDEKFRHFCDFGNSKCVEKNRLLLNCITPLKDCRLSLIQHQVLL